MKHRGHFQNDINYEWISITDALTSLASRVLGEPEEANILGLSVCIIFYLLFELPSCCGGEVQEPAPKCRTQDSESNYLKTHLKQKSPKLTKCIKNSISQTD